MCLGLFDSVKVYQHSCNAFDDKNAFSFDAAQRAQAKLERYLHYSTRYDNHAKVCRHNAAAHKQFLLYNSGALLTLLV